MDSMIKTRLFIISDIHGMDFTPSEKPLQRADVAIHCGDLTDGSKLDEFRTAIHLLKDINAPLKLAIAGNHDFTMDIPAFEKKVAEATPPLDPELVAKEYGALGEASPYTPALGAWGFQYRLERGRNFSMEKGVDIVVIHGPPKGIMDYTYGRERAGCPNLFAAVARARSRVHCFGHIHEGWGAKLVTWRENFDEQLTHFTAIDNDRFPVIEKLAGLKPSRFDTLEDAEQKLKKLERYNQDRCCTTSHCAGDGYPLEHGEQTLFANASFSGSEDLPVQRPWFVDVELPRARQIGKGGRKGI